MKQFSYNIEGPQIITQLSGLSINLMAQQICQGNPTRYRMIPPLDDNTPIFCDTQVPDAAVEADYVAVVNGVTITPLPFVGPRPPHRIADEE